MFTGSGTPASFAADEEEYVVVCRQTVERLGSYDAIIAHFEAAALAVPPLVVTPAGETGHG